MSKYIQDETHKTLEVYRIKPDLVTEHANQEEDISKGGYAGRQLFELVQNSADALSEKEHGGNIEIRLNRKYLYCADDGTVIDKYGVRALIHAHLSPKRGTAEIGRFGLGFKSVLGVTDAPEFYSRTGSFRFDRDIAKQEIQAVVPYASRFPVLRLAFLVDRTQEINEDQTLKRTGKWAQNIVRLPLKKGGYGNLEQQLNSFPPEFLLFVKHVNRVRLQCSESEIDRSISVNRNNHECTLIDGDVLRNWMVFSRTHVLSDEARSDRRTLDDDDRVPIYWAAPLDRLDQPGKFWAFFPTITSSLVAGILNAPWKTNEDRQNLLPGSYNRELIEAAASLIADSLTKLATESDPARHIDALPRRHEAGEPEQSGLLRNSLYQRLRDREIVPDQNGDMRRAEDVKYPPDVNEEAIERWEDYSDRPTNWLHRKAASRKRIAAIGRLFSPPSTGDPGSSRTAPRVPRATFQEWLEALVNEKSGQHAIEASMAALQTAALLTSEYRDESTVLGRIVWSADGVFREPNSERIFLPDKDATTNSTSASCVHPALTADPDTLEALRNLGIEPESPVSRFRVLTEELFQSEGKPKESLLKAFWTASRNVEPARAHEIVEEWHNGWQKLLLARTLSGAWKQLHSLLLPGTIVPGDGNRDRDATVDLQFHEADVELLNCFGVSEEPRSNYDLSNEPWFSNYLSRRRRDYINECRKRSIPSRPQEDYLGFVSTTGCGPLKVMEVLSDEGRALYTERLLSLSDTYEHWEMKHETQLIYPKLQFPSPAIEWLKKHGRICTSSGIVLFRSALGEKPEDFDALRALRGHPRAEMIANCFKLGELTPETIGDAEIIGEGISTPLLDLWPGLSSHLQPTEQGSCLIRCERIIAGDTEWECMRRGVDVYVVARLDEDRVLRLVAAKLGLDLNDDELALIIRRETQREIQDRREAVKRMESDAARLLEAVGRDALRSKLPESLLAILDEQDGPMSDLQIAEAAIATWHTDVLRQHRENLLHLDPPKQWAGSKRAVRFVSALGLPEEWAGEKNRRREQYLEIDGPFTLPNLHDFQEKIVDRTRSLFRDGKHKRRGMISMPTGSGKTRVAVQAVVEALRERELVGGVLWVADRDELCEQAVEAWSQVWASKGVHRERLRISRLWQGQPDPYQTSNNHVVVATVQTLAARFTKKFEDFAFLADFAVLVFDEAHRSIAPIYTGVLQELGMGGRRRQPDEPFLIGLTATPYRGHNEQETARLVGRYGDNRLDKGAFLSDDPQDVVAELQEMHVLAEADQEVIQGGELELNPDELQQMENAPWLPQSAEDRIARNSERTNAIVRAFDTHIEPSWPTLIFATSVEHSRTLAALLTARGVATRAVSSDTEPMTRRRIVEEFRSGELRTLVNYGVFREGFDAPNTRAIIVARPVYSPNLYFQMIGRGLRGTKNGGNDRCLILNVHDNILNYERQLAFSDLDWLWDRRSGKRQR